MMARAKETEVFPIVFLGPTVNENKPNHGPVLVVFAEVLKVKAIFFEHPVCTVCSGLSVRELRELPIDTIPAKSHESIEGLILAF